MHTHPNLFTHIMLLHVGGFYYPDRYFLYKFSNSCWRYMWNFSVVSSIYGIDPGPIERV